VGVLKQAYGLEDHLSRRELERRLPLESGAGRLVQGVLAAGPRENAQQHLPHVEGERVLEVLGLDEAHLLERFPEALSRRALPRAGALEVGGGEQLVADQHLAEMLVGDAALGAQDVSLAESDAPHVLGPGEMEGPRLPSDVHGTKKRGERAFGQGTLHLVDRTSGNRGTARGV
jgi:hypothetical protein